MAPCTKHRCPRPQGGTRPLFAEALET